MLFFIIGIGVTFLCQYIFHATKSSLFTYSTLTHYLFYLLGGCSFFILFQLFDWESPLNFHTSRFFYAWTIFCFFCFSQIDYAKHIVPNTWTLLYMIGGLFIHFPSLFNWIVASFCLYLCLHITNEHYLGGADIKCIGLLCLFFPLIDVAWIIFIASTVALLYALTCVKQPHSPIPFMPFLLIGICSYLVKLSSLS